MMVDTILLSNSVILAVIVNTCQSVNYSTAAAAAAAAGDCY